MLEAIEAAQRQVVLEMYWFGSDRVGRRFATALTGALRRGVAVWLIYDAIGSLEADRAQFDRLRDAGARVHEYNPVLPWRKRFRLDAMSRRDHRKILVVDEHVGFTGGINLADQWLDRAEGGGGFRDDMVRVEGPAARGLWECFHSTWRAVGEAGLHRVSEPRSSGGDQRVSVLGEAKARNRREIVRAYIAHIYRARERIWIANSYFVPDRVIRRALIRAARHGVDVRVLLPGQSDVPVVRMASRAIYPVLLKSGVRIFELQQNVLHSKTAVVDGSWSTIGTFNLDYRSLKSNLEVNVAVEDRRFGAVMEQSFLMDFEDSREVELREFEQRPRVERVAEQLAYRLRKLW
ncbi:MAG: phospholipase D-like domain-containing protein [Polyangiaceae bacterium]